MNCAFLNVVFFVVAQKKAVAGVINYYLWFEVNYPLIHLETMPWSGQWDIHSYKRP